MINKKRVTPIKREQGEYLLSLNSPLEVLSPCQIVQIDHALAELGPFSEVRLIKNKGKLRFIQKVESQELVRPPQADH